MIPGVLIRNQLRVTAPCMTFRYNRDNTYRDQIYCILNNIEADMSFEVMQNLDDWLFQLIELFHSCPSVLL